MTRQIVLPAGTSYFRFNHAFVFEHNGSDHYDGGVVEYTTNNGASWNDAGPLFTNGGYNGPIYTDPQNPTGQSPLAGRQAFGGQSYGYGSSRLDLTSLAGQTVRFRFRMGTDDSGNDMGWFIDDVRIFRCTNAGVPGAPTNVRAVASDGEATVTFDAAGVGRELGDQLVHRAGDPGRRNGDERRQPGRPGLRPDERRRATRSR